MSFLKSTESARPRDPLRPVRPFLKWPGGKRSLLPAILPQLPKRIGTFFEPFVGGGALFFALAGEAPRRFNRAVLADANERIVWTYRAVRDHAEDVVALLSTYRDDAATYEKMRNVDVDALSDVEVAAWFIYTNRCGHGGMQRSATRSKFVSGFNVPRDKSRPARTRVQFDADNLRACSRALQGVEITHGDFTAPLAKATGGDCAYLDPPYVPASDTARFTSYTAEGFGANDQRRLRDLALTIVGRGVHVIASNSDTPAVHALYSDPGFELMPVAASRRINRKPGFAGTANEVLIIGQPSPTRSAGTIP